MYQELKHRLDAADIGEEERLREMEFLKYEIAEIENASLKEGEDEELEALFEKISHSRDIIAACGEAYGLVSKGPENASDRIGKAIHTLSGAAVYDEAISDLIGQISTVDDLLNDFNRELADYLSSMDFDEKIYIETEKRLDQINHLKSKYGNSITAVMEYREKSRRRFEELKYHDELLDELKKKKNASAEHLSTLSRKLSDLRKQTAVPLAESIRQALRELNFLDVRFQIDFQPLEHFTHEGTDRICFMISTNPGVELRPLHEIASGGELSRIMLAIKTILADEEKIETLIFDEIDTGISGRTAQKVSERLSELSRERQVIAITHLPQIAAMADSHFLIEKTSDETSTISRIYPLDEEESVRELARMLGGARITDAVLDNAREMKKLAKTDLSA